MRCNGWNALSLLVVGWATCLPVTRAQVDDVETAPPQDKVAPDAKAAPPVSATDGQRMEQLLILWE